MATGFQLLRQGVVAVWALAAWLPAGAQGQAPVPAAASSAAVCGADLPAKARRVVTSPRHQIAFAMQPAPAVGRHFGIDLEVCPRGEASLPLALRVDADMPAHRHGMNYRPTVRQLDPGHYRAEGLLFHMAGRWRLMFDLSVDGRLDRITHEIDLE